MRILISPLANQRYDDRMLFENAYDLLSGVAGQLRFLCWQRDRISDVSGSCEKIMSAIFRAAGSTAGCGCMAVCPCSVCEMAESRGQTLLLSFLLFSPSVSRCWVTAAVYRMAIVPEWCCWYFQHDQTDSAQGAPLKKQLPWAVLTGMTLAFFWQIREDSVWILPFIAVMTVWNVGYVILVLHKKLNTKAVCFTASYLLPTPSLFSANTDSPPSIRSTTVYS